MTKFASSAATLSLRRSGRKLYAIVICFLTAEIWVLQVLQRPHFNLLSDVVLGVLLLSVVGVVVSGWLDRSFNLMLHLHVMVSICSILSLPAMSLGTLAGSTHTDPWVWWIFISGALSAALASGPRPVSIIFLAFIALAWLLVQISAQDAIGSLVGALGDAASVLFLSGAVSSLVSWTKAWGSALDDSTSKQIEGAIKKAKADAVEREEQRVDALVHDSVLNTLLVAAKAKTEIERQAAKRLVDYSIGEIETMATSKQSLRDTNSIALFEALRKLAHAAAPDISIATRGGDLRRITSGVAEALIGASLQCIRNSVQHSSASRLELELESLIAGTIVIRVIDNGKGFKPDRLDNSRLGISGSIISRMKSVGGSAKVRSSPNAGTTVTLRWQE